MLRIEPVPPILNIEPVLPMLRMLPALPMLSTLPELNKLATLKKLPMLEMQPKLSMLLMLNALLMFAGAGDCAGWVGWVGWVGSAIPVMSRSAVRSLLFDTLCIVTLHIPLNFSRAVKLPRHCGVPRGVCQSTQWVMDMIVTAMGKA